MLKIQEWLRQTTGDLEALKKLYAIHYKFHGEFPNLVQLKYDMIDSPMGDPMVQECRGLILDRSADWEVVAWPFHKFFNSDEGHAAKIDWTTARVQEKVDGSLIIMYWYEGKWRVATSGTPDASGQVNGLPMTFAELFWKTFEARGIDRVVPGPVEAMEHMNEDFTFMWELTSPYNRIVVQHEKPELTFIGCRNVKTGQEVSVEGFHKWWPTVKHFDLTSLEAIGESFSRISALNQEGYVVVDANFNRVKVKHPQYVALHHLRGEGSSPSPKGALSVIRQGEMGELLSYWPEWAPIFTEVDDRYQKLAVELESDYRRICAAVPPVPAGVVQTDKRAQGLFRKEFAGLATKTRVPAVMFSLLDGKSATVRESLNKMQVDHLASVLKLDDIKIDPQLIFGKVTP